MAALRYAVSCGVFHGARKGQDFAVKSAAAQHRGPGRRDATSPRGSLEPISSGRATARRPEPGQCGAALIDPLGSTEPSFSLQSAAHQRVAPRPVAGRRRLRSGRPWRSTGPKGQAISTRGSPRLRRSVQPRLRRGYPRGSLEPSHSSPNRAILPPVRQVNASLRRPNCCPPRGSNEPLSLTFGPTGQVSKPDPLRPEPSPREQPQADVSRSEFLRTTGPPGHQFLRPGPAHPEPLRSALSDRVESQPMLWLSTGPQGQDHNAGPAGSG